jgi:cytochrome c553
MKKHFISVFVTSIVLLACSKTNEETERAKSTGSNGNTGGSTSSCDTANMKYVTNIQPVIQANCYGCHGNGAAAGGISLATYAGVKQQVSSGRLMGAITHASGYKPMPMGAAKLDDCTINKIQAWINRSAANN